VKTLRGYSTLYNIANGIYAAAKISEVLYLQQNRKGMHKTNPLTGACKILDILAQYAPQEERKVLGAKLMNGKLCLEACNNINKHFSTYAKNFDADKIAQALSIIKPVLGGEEKRIVDKMLKVYDALV
jgi:hypothetical protein